MAYQFGKSPVPPVDLAAVAAYLDMLFGYVDLGENEAVWLRGIGEKGTPKEGVHRENIRLVGLSAETVARMATKWGEHSVATYIIPAVVRGDDPGEPGIAALTTLVVDIDKGDTDAALEYLRQHIGQPTMVVNSGGVTETGQLKMHVYWRLTEPSADVDRIAANRKALAFKVGGDTSFGRKTQVIRVPGTVHGKGGKHTVVTIREHNASAEHDLDALAESIETMPALPGCEDAPNAALISLMAPGGGINFNRPERSSMDDALTNPIHEGGDEDRSRYSEFSKVAGHYIHTIRTGAQTAYEARNALYGWVLANMVPPWPPARIEQEWRRLLNEDTKNHGPMPAEAPPPPAIVPPAGAAVEFAGRTIDAWAVDRYTKGAAPLHEFLVRDLVLKGQPHLIAASGGVGKTFLALDLALKIATYPSLTDPRWLGQPLDPDCHGTAVVITAEDDQNEIHRRIAALDPKGHRFDHPGKLIVVPLINAGGSFTLAERGRDGNVTDGARWSAMVAELATIADLRLVVIDTLAATLHDDESSATVINEYMRALNKVPAMGAASMVTHHLRKGEAITSGEELLAAVRGSTALPNSFRATIGIWAATDWKAKMQAMRLTPSERALYYAEVVKDNAPMLKGRLTLLRHSNGILEDRTAAATKASIDGEPGAWLVEAIKRAAEHGHPYYSTGANSPYSRRAELPPRLRALDLSNKALPALIAKLEAAGKVVKANIDGSKLKNTLDVPGGPVATGLMTDFATAAYTPDWDTYEYDSFGQEVTRK